MELIYMLAGVVIIYSFVHLAFLQKKAYEERTTYEKVITWIALVSILLITIGSAS